MTTISALLKRKCKKRAGPEALQLTKGENNKLQEGKNSQLGEQAKQLCPPLQVSSDIVVANLPAGMVPGTNPGDYLPDDIQFDPLQVDELKFRHGYPLVRPDQQLPTMMRRFHEWYMDTCKNSGLNNVMLMVKDKHDLLGIDTLCAPFEELFQLYMQWPSIK